MEDPSGSPPPPAGSGESPPPARGRRGRNASLAVGLILALVIAAVATAWLFSEPELGTAPASLERSAAATDDEFGRRVRAYILENPEVLVEALRRLQERKRASERDELKKLVAQHSDEIFRDPDAPVGGNPDGDVTVVEFFDYNCPYCRRVAPVMIEAERDDPDLRFVYKEFPILGPDSVFAARAALASRKQGRYLEFHRAMMLAKGVLDEDKVREIAGTVGLDVARLEKDMEDPEIQAIIDRNRALARALRITGTPGFVIGEETVRGAIDLEGLKAVVRRARQSSPAARR